MAIKNWKSAVGVFAIAAGLLVSPVAAQENVGSAPEDQFKADPVGFFVLNTLREEVEHYFDRSHFDNPTQKTPERLERARQEGHKIQYCFSVAMLDHTFKAVDNLPTKLSKARFAGAKEVFERIRKGLVTKAGTFTEEKTCKAENGAALRGYQRNEIGRMANFHFDYGTEKIIGLPTARAREFLGGLPLDTIKGWVAGQQGAVTMIEQPTAKLCSHLWVAKSILDKAPNIKMSGHGVSREKLDSKWNELDCGKLSGGVALPVPKP